MAPQGTTAQLSPGMHSNPNLDSDEPPGHVLTAVGSHEWQGELPERKDAGKQSQTIPTTLGPELASSAERGSSMRIFLSQTVLWL